MTPLSPSAVVQAQLDAYNAKDLDALMATYAPDATQFALHGDLLARGHDRIRPRYEQRFLEPDLHARLLSRTVMGNFVTDLEIVTRNFPEGLARSRCCASTKWWTGASCVPRSRPARPGFSLPPRQLPWPPLRQLDRVRPPALASCP
jgi:hypothetical protein